MLSIHVNLAKLRTRDGQADYLSGNAEYYAPEMAMMWFKNKRYRIPTIDLEPSNNTKKTDVWGLGYVNILEQ